MNNNVYYIGSICEKHPEINGKRYIKTKVCFVCRKLTIDKWNKNNQEKLKEIKLTYAENHRDQARLYSKEYNLKNKEKLKVKRDKWNKENPEKRKSGCKKWLDNNSHKIAIYNSLRRATKENSTPLWANKFYIEEAYRLAKLRNKVCGGIWEVDHIVPLKSKLVCGLHWEQNLRVVTRNTNRTKSNSIWPDMP